MGPRVFDGSALEAIRREADGFCAPVVRFRFGEDLDILAFNWPHVVLELNQDEEVHAQRLESGGRIDLVSSVGGVQEFAVFYPKPVEPASSFGQKVNKDRSSAEPSVFAR